MKMKFVFFLSILFFCAVCLSACSVKQSGKASMVNSERRFANYMKEGKIANDSSTIDLSEGPRLKYEAYFGPKNLNFDVKIVDPY